MTAPHNENGPAGAPTPCQAEAQSITPLQDQKMNDQGNSTKVAILPALSRRGLFGGVTLLAIPAAAAAVRIEPARTSIDDFLARASASEKAWYHACALAEAMNEVRPGCYRASISHEYGMAIVVDDEFKKLKEGPLLAEDRLTYGYVRRAKS
jgi:hypothetical protein